MSVAEVVRDQQDPADTVWVEHVSWIDRVPRAVSMIVLFLAFVALWQIATMLEVISPIILPAPMEVAAILRTWRLPFEPATATITAVMVM